MLTTLLFSALLSSDNFATREAAERACPVAAATWLQVHPDMEVRCRATHVLDRARESARQERRDWLEHQFLLLGRPLWIDGVPLDYPDRMCVIQHYLQEARGEWGGPQFPRYYAAARMFFADLIESGWPLENVERLLWATAERCRRNPSGYWVDP